MGSNGESAVVRALASYQCGAGSNRGVDSIFGLSLVLAFSFAQCVRTLLVKVEVTVVSKKTMMITPAKVFMLNININSEH